MRYWNSKVSGWTSVCLQVCLRNYTCKAIHQLQSPLDLHTSQNVKLCLQNKLIGLFNVVLFTLPTGCTNGSLLEINPASSL